MLSFLSKYYKFLGWSSLFFMMAGINILFYNEPIIDTITHRYFYINIIVILIFLFAVEYNNKIKCCRADLLIIIAFLYLFFHTVFKNFTVDNIIQILYPFVIYFSVRCILEKSSNNVLLILLPFVLLSFIEGIIGILQYYEIIDGGTFFNFKVVGTFSNPTRLAGFLLITFPLFGLYKSMLNNNVIKILLILNLFSIILTGNRAAIIGCVVLMLYYSLRYNKIKISTKKIVFIIVSLLMLFVILFLYKQNSAMGRLFIWKISILKLYEYFLFGSGINSFISIYNNAQGEYFSNNNVSELESCNANFIAYPYNDILMILIEFGLPLFFLFIYLFVNVVKNKCENNTILICLKLSLIGIFSYSMFSYLFKVPILLEMFIIIYASIVTIENNMQHEDK